MPTSKIAMSATPRPGCVRSPARARARVASAGTPRRPAAGSRPARFDVAGHRDVFGRRERHELHLAEPAPNEALHRPHPEPVGLGNASGLSGRRHAHADPLVPEHAGHLLDQVDLALDVDAIPGHLDLEVRRIPAGRGAVRHAQPVEGAFGFVGPLTSKASSSDARARSHRHPSAGRRVPVLGDAASDGAARPRGHQLRPPGPPRPRGPQDRCRARSDGTPPCADRAGARCEGCRSG